MVGILIRAITDSTLFIGALLVYLPAQALTWAGVARPSGLGMPQFLGAAVSTAGAVLGGWCIVSFALLGRGTPAPFDPPRRLVVRGPYQYVRNPLYLAASLALAGAALFYHSGALLVYAAVFLLLTHVLVVSYEEPTLRETFGKEYEAYRQHVHRWLPTL